MQDFKIFQPFTTTNHRCCISTEPLKGFFRISAMSYMTTACHKHLSTRLGIDHHQGSQQDIKRFKMIALFHTTWYISTYDYKIRQAFNTPFLNQDGSNNAQYKNPLGRVFSNRRCWHIAPQGFWTTMFWQLWLVALSRPGPGSRGSRSCGGVARWLMATARLVKHLLSYLHVLFHNVPHVFSIDPPLESLR